MSDLAERLRAEQIKPPEPAAPSGYDALRAEHKKASRAFFETMESFFPPESDMAFWERVSDRACQVYVETGKPLLLKHLMVAMMEYFEDIVKKGWGGGDGD